MSRFFNDGLKKLTAYTPGEQPDKNEAYIKLNTNESPFPPSPAVTREITESELKTHNLYPDPKCAALKAGLAKTYGVKPENIFISNGSDEALAFLFLGFFGGRGVAFPNISYGFYKVFGDLYGVNYTEIPLKDDYTVDADDFAFCDKNVVIANPNAPTGISLPVKDIEKILRNNKNLVVIDEAYVDFGGESCLPLIGKYENLAVVQTYSKSRSFAGGRLGYVIGNADIISDLEKIKYSTNPYNINSYTQLAGLLALGDADYYRKNCETIIKTRNYTTKELVKLGFSVLPSKANFVFAEKNGLDGKTLYEKLKEKGILVRHFDKKEIKDFLRISIGTAAQMEYLISTLKQITEE
jgi:histidinol-phosphate aminotransferase